MVSNESEYGFNSNKRNQMDKKSELLRRLSRNWDDVYTQLTLAEIPWHSEKPDREFIELIEGREVLPHMVLDVGCGAGTDAIYLASKGCKVTGIDISEEAIGIARRRAREADVDIEFIAKDFMKLELGDESFDFINDRGCFHHMEPDDREDFAAEINRILQKGGNYYLRCWSDKMEETYRGPYRISKEEITDTFSKYFTLGDITEFRFGGKGARGYTCLMKKEK
jgi:ubiquinone/menaquinone biosynthesis C-methylase UbiE